MKQLEGQTVLELFARPKPKDVWGMEGCCEWLMRVHGCDSNVRFYAAPIFAKFSESEAFERCKCLTALNG